jgi:hypothetical protein
VPTDRAVTSRNDAGRDAMRVIVEIAAVKDVLVHIEPFDVRRHAHAEP